MVLNVLSIVAGVLLLGLSLNDVFQSVIVPRAVGRELRPSWYAWRFVWLLWPALAWRIYPQDAGRREDFLATFAPFGLVTLLILWIGMAIAGYGFIFYGLRSGLAPLVQTVGGATYYGGTVVSTLGFGDVVPHAPLTRALSICAAVTGLGLFAITTAYLFAIFGSFQAREAFVVTTGARSGSPSSGVNLLAIAGYSQTTGDLPALMMAAQGWAATLMETHLAYPPLGYFRSSHDDTSWVGTLGTLLDAAALLMTTIDGVPSGQARLFYNIGRHATEDLSRHFGIQSATESALVERSEFDNACDRLAAAGYTVIERDAAWGRFRQLRTTYAPHLSAMARFFQIPPLQWIGDRSSIASH